MLDHSYWKIHEARIIPVRGGVHDSYIFAMHGQRFSEVSGINNHNKLEYSKSLDLGESHGSQSVFPAPVV